MLAFGCADEINADSEYAKISGGLQDIQERMEAMRLREREHSLNTVLIDSLPGSYLMADASGRILRWNANFEQTFRLPGDSPLHTRWADVFLPEDRPITAKAVAECFESGTCGFPVFVTDMNNCWTYLNKPALTVLGVDTPAEVIGKKSWPWRVDRTAYIGGAISDFYVNAEERTAFLDEVRNTGSLNWRVVSVRAANGGIREMLANAFQAEYYDEPCIMSWFPDIAEMRETER